MVAMAFAASAEAQAPPPPPPMPVDANVVRLQLRVFDGGEDVTRETRVRVYPAGQRTQPIRMILGADQAYEAEVPVGLYDVQAIMPATAFLPEIQTKRSTLRLFGQYAVQKNLSVRVDAVYDRFRTSDWTFTDWIYDDGTTAVNPNSSSTFLGVSVVYRMW